MARAGDGYARRGRSAVVRRTGQTRGRVVIAGEGFRGIRRRIAGLALHYGIDTRRLPLFVSSASAEFTDRESTAHVITSVRALADAAKQAPVLVIIDTLSRNLAGCR